MEDETEQRSFFVRVGGWGADSERKEDVEWCLGRLKDGKVQEAKIKYV